MIKDKKSYFKLFSNLVSQAEKIIYSFFNFRINKFSGRRKFPMAVDRMCACNIRVIKVQLDRVPMS